MRKRHMMETEQDPDRASSSAVDGQSPGVEAKRARTEAQGTSGVLHKMTGWLRRKKEKTSSYVLKRFQSLRLGRGDSSSEDPPREAAPATIISQPKGLERHVRRGYALIVNHYSYDVRLMQQNRNGCFADANNLHAVLSSFGFQVDIELDLTIEQLEGKLKSVANMDHSKHDCLLVVVSTHGLEDGNLYAKDGIHNIQATWHPFITNRSLDHLPKIFIVQACRGTLRDEGNKLELELTPSPSTESKNFNFESCSARSMADDGKKFATLQFARRVHPDHLDVLTAYSTTEEHVSWRSWKHGAHFLQCLCQVLSDQGHLLDLATLLTRVNKRLSRHLLGAESHEPARYKQTSCVTSSLTYKIFLHKRQYN